MKDTTIEIIANLSVLGIMLLFSGGVWLAALGDLAATVV